MLRPCTNPAEGCQFRKQIGHHLWFPKRDYQTDLEKVFRELPQNKIQICACAEWLIHNTMRPPDKPSVEEMVIACTVVLDGA